MIAHSFHYPPLPKSDIDELIHIASKALAAWLRTSPYGTDSNQKTAEFERIIARLEIGPDYYADNEDPGGVDPSLVQELNDQVSGLNDDAQILKNTISMLGAEVNAANDEISRLQKALLHSDVSIVTAENLLDDAKKKLAGYDESLKVAQEEAALALDAFHAERQRALELETKLEEAETTIRRRYAKITAQDETNEALLETLAGRNETLTARNREMVSLNEEIVKAKEWIEKAEARAIDAETLCAEQHRTIVQYRKDTETSDETIETLRRDLNINAGAIAQLSRDASNREKMYEARKAELITAYDRVEELSETLTLERDEWETEEAHLRREIDLLVGEKDTLRRTVRQHQDGSRTLSKRIHVLQEQLAELSKRPPQYQLPTLPTPQDYADMRAKLVDALQRIQLIAGDTVKDAISIPPTPPHGTVVIDWGTGKGEPMEASRPLLDPDQ